jgi:hypothetical protein
LVIRQIFLSYNEIRGIFEHRKRFSSVIIDHACAASAMASSMVAPDIGRHLCAVL